VLAAGVAVLSGCVEPASTAEAAAANTVVGGDDRNGPYEPVVGWWKAAPNHDETWHWGSMGSVSAVDPDRVFAVTWGDRNAGTMRVSSGRPPRTWW
jgi:hypothetical protein